MRAAEHRVVFRIGAGVATFAGWLVLAALGNPLQWRFSIDDGGDLLGLLAWFVPAAVLACTAGWRRDPLAAVLAFLGGILGAAVVAWARGAPEVEPGADPAMRAAYEQMVIVISAGVAAVLGAIVVAAGYALGRLVRRRRHAVRAGDR